MKTSPPWLKGLVLVALGIVLGAAANAVRPRGAIPWVYDWTHHVEYQAREAGLPMVSTERMKTLLQDEAWLVLDARPLNEYDSGHLPGALSLPHRDVDHAFAEVAMMFVPGQKIATYCAGKDCDESLALALFLRDQGYTNLVLYAGGMAAWERAGAPVEGGAP